MVGMEEHVFFNIYLLSSFASQDSFFCLAAGEHVRTFKLAVEGNGKSWASLLKSFKSRVHAQLEPAR